MNDLQNQKLDDPQTPGPIEPEPLPSPSPTFYSTLAAALVASLNQFTAAVPDFDSPLQVPEGFVRSKRRLPKKFVQDAVSALLVNAELQGLKISNVAEVVDDRQYIEAFVPLIRHLEAAVRGLKVTIEVREARLGANAQKIYNLTKVLAQDRDRSTIAKHLNNMRQSRRIVSRKKPAPVPGSTPAPESAQKKEDSGTR